MPTTDQVNPGKVWPYDESVSWKALKAFSFVQF